jgi:hypothetical protein
MKCIRITRDARSARMIRIYPVRFEHCLEGCAGILEHTDDNSDSRRGLGICPRTMADRRPPKRATTLG